MLVKSTDRCTCTLCFQFLLVVHSCSDFLMNTDDPHLKCHLMSQIILHICLRLHVVVSKTPLSSIVSQRKQKIAHGSGAVISRRQTSQQVLKLAAKPIQYDNDEKTWLEFRFKLESYLTLVDERYVALLLNAESQPVANLPTGTEESAVTIRTLTHTVRLAGDTDHGKKPETGAKSAEQKWVRSVETDGGRERAENRGSEIRDAASGATAWNE